MNHHFKILESALVNGRWVSHEKTLEVINPADKKIIGCIPNLGEKETIAAIDAAEKALPTWSNTAASERANLLLKWHDLILKNKEALARLLILENGKPLNEARGEVEYGASFVRWFAEEARRIDGDVISTDQPNKRYLVIKQPIGIVGAITPWNFPIAMITRKCAPALAAGCTVVLKPSELTPFSALALGELALEAGIPAGILNIITGEAEPIGKTLCEDSRVRKISFTGSTKVGQWLIAHSAQTVKKLSLELGGNAPFIIFEDADLDKAATELMASKFRNSGQTCVCANRIFIHEKIYATFLEKLIPKVRALNVADASKDETAQIGPLINQAGLAKVERLVKTALDNGATCVVGGKALTALGGFFYEPTILSNLKPTMEIACEEIFGPVLALYTFSDEKEVVQLANASQAGLAGYFFTQDPSRIFRLSETLQYGMLGINTGIISSYVVPFGGIKYSGYGKEGSKYGIEEYLQMKTLCWDVS